MTTSIVRRCGACLLAGGLLLTVAYIFYPSSARSDSIRPTAAIGLVGVLIILPALIAFQMTQAGRARIAGWLGVTLTVLGIAALEIPHMMFGVFDPHRLYDLDVYHSGPFGAAAFYGSIALVVRSRDREHVRARAVVRGDKLNHSHHSVAVVRCHVVSQRANQDRPLSRWLIVRSILDDK